MAYQPYTQRGKPIDNSCNCDNTTIIDPYAKFLARAIKTYLKEFKHSTTRLETFKATTKLREALEEYELSQ